MSELKKCPFCGFNVLYYLGQDGTEYIRCLNRDCPCHRFDFAKREQWQTRPLEDALQAERDLLRAKLSEYEGENKRWHSFETVQAIAKERDLLRQQLDMAKEIFTLIDDAITDDLMENGMPINKQWDEIYRKVIEFKMKLGEKK